MKWAFSNWEKIVFRSLGLILFVAGIFFLLEKNISGMATLFGFSMFAWLYANISQFKRIKGLGFEAELWEDKQKEAADLIESLKTIVGVYTSEVVMARILRGRLMNDKETWDQKWKFFDNMVKQHKNLGQEIDFSELNNTVRAYFFLDMIVSDIYRVRRAFEKADASARNIIKQESGTPITNSTKYGERLKQQKELQLKQDDYLEKALERKLAESTLSRIDTAKLKYKKIFNVELTVDDLTIENLTKMKKWEHTEDLVITPEMVVMTEREQLLH